MPLWYPERYHVALIRKRLAARFFPEYVEASPPLPFGAIAGESGAASLDSALNLPRQPYYRGLYNKAGALLRSMIKNHPFVDGNKRVGLVTTLNFLLMNNNVLLLATNEEMVQFALELAASEPDMPWQDVAAWIKSNTISMPPSEAELKRKLKGKQPEIIRERVSHMKGYIDEFEQFLDELLRELGS